MSTKFKNIYNIKTTYEIKNKYKKNEILLLEKFDKNFIKKYFIETPTRIGIDYKVDDFEYMRGNSNLNFISKNIHLKIKINKETISGYEKIVINKIKKYKNDYNFISDDIYIKKLYKGKTKNIINSLELISLVKEVKKLHKIKTKKLIKYDKELSGKKVFCHGDLRPKNIIFSNNKVHLIDFEWSRKNSLYWDLASIIVNFNLNNDQKLLLKRQYGKINDEYLEESIKEVILVNKLFDESNYFKIN